MSATATGAARAGFERLMARFAVGLRVGGAVAGSLGGLLGLAAPASVVVVVGVAVAGLLGWAVTYRLVAVSVPAELPALLDRAVTVIVQEEQDRQWIEARWRRRLDRPAH